MQTYLNLIRTNKEILKAVDFCYETGKLRMKNDYQPLHDVIDFSDWSSAIKIHVCQLNCYRVIEERMPTYCN